VHRHDFTDKSVAGGGNSGKYEVYLTALLHKPFS
jgi:hypothetical protein